MRLFRIKFFKNTKICKKSFGFFRQFFCFFFGFLLTFLQKLVFNLLFCLSNITCPKIFQLVLSHHAKKNDNNLKKLCCVFETMVETICATCRVTGYPCLSFWNKLFQTMKSRKMYLYLIILSNFTFLIFFLFVCLFV